STAATSSPGARQSEPHGHRRVAASNGSGSRFRWDGNGTRGTPQTDDQLFGLDHQKEHDDANKQPRSGARGTLPWPPATHNAGFGDVQRSSCTSTIPARVAAFNAAWSRSAWSA